MLCPAPDTDLPTPDLLERTAELEALHAAVADAAAGRGAVVVLEAAAGLGKTALLDDAVRFAAGAGCDVRRAAPGPLERHFPFGVVRTLLESHLRGVSERDRKLVLQGAAADAGRLLMGGRAPARAATPVVAGGVVWLCSALAAARPLVLIVDDAQCADRESLEVLLELARAINDLPVVIAIAARGDDPEAAADLLGMLADSAVVLRPAPLTLWGAIRLVRRYAPDVSLRTCRDAHHAADGSPWLLSELGCRLAVYGPAALRDAGAPVSAVARNVVRARLAALAPRDRGVAAALAVLGPGAPAEVVAGLAGIGLGELAPARDALRAAGLLASDRARLAHGLISAAILDGLAAAERDRLHRAAAHGLAALGTGFAAAGSHLLECEPHGDPHVTALLLRAAAEAPPRQAATFLERALRERAAGDDRGRIMAELGIAASDAELPDGRRRLHDALAEPTGAHRRTEVLTRLAGLQALAGGDAAIAGLLAAEAAPRGGDRRTAARGEDAPATGWEPRDDTPALAVAVARLDVLGAPADRARVLDGLGPVREPVLARAVLAHRAWLAVEQGDSTADACARRALAALDDGLLLRDAATRFAYHLAVRTLVRTDHHGAARRAIEALRDEAARRDSHRLRAAAAWHAGELALRTGEVRLAELEARAALELASGELATVAAGAREVLAAALAEQGAFDEAAALPRTRAHARLWLATGDYERARAEAGDDSLAALALAHLGRRDEAAALAAEAVERAARFGAPVPLLAALHARAVAEPDDGARTALCHRALAIADGVTAALETVRIRLELGRTLSRQGSRVEARDALGPALAQAEAVGACPLAERARRELTATGLRRRRASTEGEAPLTPRQRQICALAAGGKGNREIGHALFLSMKTVETHLAAAYRKLGINSRTELGTALADA